MRPLTGRSQSGTDAEELSVSLNAVYTWNYAQTSKEVRTLYENAKRGMWNSATDLPWGTQVDPDASGAADQMNPLYGTLLWRKLDKKTELPRLRRLYNAYVLSSFLHGEQGALLAASELVTSLPTADGKLYAATQVMDEARHVEVYDRYLREKLELVFPVPKDLKRLLDDILTDPRWDMKCLGMQLLVEGLALAAFGLFNSPSSDPLIRTIVRLISRDEARHMAFGMTSLKGVFTQMSVPERKEREEFVVDASRLMCERFMLKEVWEEMGMPVAACVQATENSEMMRLFRTMLFSKVVPNLKRVGLMTDTVRMGLRELGILHFESWLPPDEGESGSEEAGWGAP
jgi:hypothetical protein